MTVKGPNVEVKGATTKIRGIDVPNVRLCLPRHCYASMNCKKLLASKAAAKQDAVLVPGSCSATLPPPPLTPLPIPDWGCLPTESGSCSWAYPFQMRPELHGWQTSPWKSTRSRFWECSPLPCTEGMVGIRSAYCSSQKEADST